MSVNPITNKLNRKLKKLREKLKVDKSKVSELI